MLTNLAGYESEPFATFDHTSSGSRQPPIQGLQAWWNHRERRLGQIPKSVPGRSTTKSLVKISPADAATRKAVTWDGMTAEIVETTGLDRTDFAYSGREHVLVVCERGTRRAGDTSVAGLPRSGMGALAGKICFVPAGRDYRHWQELRTPARFVFIYLDTGKLPIQALDTPRVLFEDALLLAASLRLGDLFEDPTPSSHQYLEALGSVVLHELERLNGQPSAARQPIRGGLAAWQQRTVAAFIEEHLAEPISLASLAQLVRLSPFHFSRAFKQSFGLPPHRYHIDRRIERAKSLLVESSMSVTQIGFEIGFSETSAFSATFRRLTGTTPTAYTRSYA